MNKINILSRDSQWAIALIVAISLLFWLTGLPGWINSARAATLTSVSDTLSDSDLNVVADHTIAFTSPTGVAADATITVTFDAGFTIGSATSTDVDLKDDGGDVAIADVASGTTWGAVFSGQVLTLTNGSAAVAASSVMEIQIGLNATADAAGANQITNPNSAGSVVISIGGTFGDTADLRVAIIDDVTVTATVDTTLTFTISGVASGQPNANGEGGNTSVTTGATTIPFGLLSATANASTTARQDLAVTTNATNGFTVTLQFDQPLTSGTGADIDPFKDGAGTATPEAWVQPSSILDSENTYGHFGFTSADDLNADEFGTALYAGNATTSARDVFSHTGPADGSTANKGATEIGFKIAIDALQEAGTDYTAQLTYVATPTF